MGNIPHALHIHVILFNNLIPRIVYCTLHFLLFHLQAHTNKYIPILLLFFIFANSHRIRLCVRGADTQTHATYTRYQIIVCYLFTMHSVIGISIWNKIYYIQKSANNLFYLFVHLFVNVRMSPVCEMRRDATQTDDKNNKSANKSTENVTENIFSTFRFLVDFLYGQNWVFGIFVNYCRC